MRIPDADSVACTDANSRTRTIARTGTIACARSCAITGSNAGADRMDQMR